VFLTHRALASGTLGEIASHDMGRDGVEARASRN
jgi:hypothetical protein